MTLVWFVIWFVSDRIGDREVLRFDPADWWTITLLGAIALDLGGHHAAASSRRQRCARPD
ncbi:MAG: hypothetical protein U0R50_13120 [Gaiellales bacterium]